MKHLLKLSAVCLLLTSACGTPSSESQEPDSKLNGIFSGSSFDTGIKGCPTAKLVGLDDSLSYFFWNTRIRTDINLSNEDTSLGVDIAEEVRRSRDPLNGSGIVARARCSRAFIQNNQTQEKTYLDPTWTLGSSYATDWRPDRNYAVIRVIGEAKVATQTVRLDFKTGLRKVLATEPAIDCPPSANVIPSPLGTHIALYIQTGTCGNEPSPQHATLQFLTEAGDTLGQPSAYDFEQSPFLSWMSESKVNFSDSLQTFEVLVPPGI